MVNTGTIPVKLYFFDEEGNRLTPLPYEFTVGDGAVTCTLDGEDGAQVHPEGSESHTLSCVVEQGASEDSEYTTQIYIQAHQWNKPPS